MRKRNRIAELWRLSKKIYREIMFQSTFHLKTGVTLPPEGEIKNIQKTSEKPFNPKKISQTVFIVFMNLISAFVSWALASKSIETASLYYTSIMLITVLYDLSFSFMEEISLFLSSRVSEFLIMLPLSHEDVSEILLMCFVRIFDKLIVITMLLIPITYGIVFSSISGAIIVFLGVLVTEVFALSLAFFLASYFYFRIAFYGKMDAWKAIVRAFYILSWIAPFLLLNLMIGIVSKVLIEATSQSYPLLALLYPFSFGLLASATICNSGGLFSTTFSFLASSIYVVASILLLKWLIGRVSSIWRFKTVFQIPPRNIMDTTIKPKAPWLGLVKKDLKIIFRAHHETTMMILMPFGITILMGMFIHSLSSFKEYFNADAFLALALLTILFFILSMPLLLLSLEEKVYSCIACLPIEKRTLLFSKVFLSLVLYLVLFAILLSMILIIAPEYVLILIGSGVCNFPAVFSSLTFVGEYSIKLFGKRLVPTPSQALTRIIHLTIIRGSLPVMIPVFANYFLTMFFSEFWGRIGLMVSSMVEFAIAIMVLKRMK